MKKIYLLLMAALLPGMAMSQTPFFTETSYRGAFGPVGTEDWTAGWTEWDPQNVEYPAPTVVKSGTISADETWASTDVVDLQGFVYVTNGATLTIEPGCIIRGDAATKGSLIITKGSFIDAQGTAESPIVFTSKADVGSRNVGDWGGIILLGDAPVNRPSAIIEGGLDAQYSSYGGTNAADNSGVLSYVRIEFGGAIYTTDNEINGLTMGGIGSGTTIDHIQCSYINDDSFEWFGGTVNCKYLIAYGGIDDDFDTDYGYSGYVQFALGVRDPDNADAAGDSNGFESDNDGNGSNAKPQTSVIFSNVTLIGPYGLGGGSASQYFGRGARIRRNSALSLFNSIVTDWGTTIRLDDAATRDNVGDTSLISNNLFVAVDGSNADYSVFGNAETKDILMAMNDSLDGTAALDMVSPYGDDEALPLVNPDFRLAATSPAATGADFTSDLFAGLVITSIEDVITTSSLKLFPNPTADNVLLTLELKKAGQIQVNILDVTGRQLTQAVNKHMGATQEVVKLNTANLSNGLYMVQIVTEEGAVTKRLIVAR
ncbi:Por secretion system C-terminal sorting domain-containing protein [Catalinimonas alkaloidigena]|uniref:Por secretion system C-terminal sorting domain-containing protein n=1 Tax=Catalinimonas alkaloidigena TaxID=1075417 RepID=A0A1G9DNH0_9BACT|nr:T9SS type A sorting domain-containing protein [Catalinimonas alkaloidigena]SDK65335.1 Por secretion system C-terminal sorting domain-containing protein [Catalinimonas alkaloidigena]